MLPRSTAGEAARVRYNDGVKRLPVVDQLRVRAPCEVPWETMEAREDGRHCVQCARVVHDVATMTRAEAIALAGALDRGERICRRVSRRRSDGAILTADGFLVPDAPPPRVSRRLVAMATAGATALAACAGPEVMPATQAAANHPRPLVIAPLPPPAAATPRDGEARVLPAHERGEPPEPEVVPPFPGPAVVGPIGPPAPPKKEKVAPAGKAKPVKPPSHDLEITGGY